MADNFSIVPEQHTEVWEWKTDVMSTWNGSETRLSLFPAPRVTLDFTYPGLTQAERREVLRLLAEDLSAPDSVPMWAWSARLTATTAAGNNVISLDTRRAQLTSGDRIVLLNPVTEVTEDFTVVSLTSTTVTLSNNVSQDVGTAWIAFKAMTGLIKGAPISWGVAAGGLRVSVDSWVDPYTQYENNAQSLNTLDSVYWLEKLALSGGTEEPEWDLTVDDFGIGRRTLGTRNPTMDITGRRAYSINRNDLDEVDYWKLFLDTVRGNWKAFLMSTQLQDMTLASGLSQAGTTMSINETGQSSLFHAYESFKHFEVVYSDGTSSQHTITGSTSGSVTFTPALPNDPKVSNVTRISYLLKVRMSDRLEWRHGPVKSVLSFDFMTTDDG